MPCSRNVHFSPRIFKERERERERELTTPSQLAFTCHSDPPKQIDALIMVGMPGELFFSAASFLYGSLETEKNNVNSYKFGKGNEWFNGSVLFARWGNRVKKETARIHFGICFLHIYKCVRVRVRVRAHVCVSEVVKSREKSILQCSVFGSHPARKFVCTKSWNFCIILLSKHRNHVDQPCLQAVNLI